jgi:hypothetical protein
MLGPMRMPPDATGGVSSDDHSFDAPVTLHFDIHESCHRQKDAIGSRVLSPSGLGIFLYDR